MAAGFGVTKEPGTERFAERFNAAGFDVLAFDFRRLGESGGEPRQLVRIADQLADWRAAVEFARTLPGVERVALWSFSLTGGQVVQLAAEGLGLAAAIAQSANVDGPAALRNASKYQKAGDALRLIGRALVGSSRLVPLAEPPGTLALLNNPDAQDGTKVFAGYDDWERAIDARSVLPAAFYRPAKYAADVKCPLLYVVCTDDRSALAAPALKAAAKSPKATVLEVPGGHYAPFLDEHEVVVDAEIAFLTKHLATVQPAR